MTEALQLRSLDFFNQSTTDTNTAVKGLVKKTTVVLLATSSFKQ